MKISANDVKIALAIVAGTTLIMLPPDRLKKTALVSGVGVAAYYFLLRKMFNK